MGRWEGSLPGTRAEGPIPGASQGRGLPCFAPRVLGDWGRARCASGPRLPPGARLSDAMVGGRAGAAGVISLERESSSWAGPRESGWGLGRPPAPGVRPGSSGHCVLGLRHSRLPWPRGQVWSWLLRERLGTVAWCLPRTPGGGPGRSGLGPADTSSLRLSRSWRSAHCGPGSVAAARRFCPLQWGERRVETLKSQSRLPPPTLLRRPLPVMFTAHGVLRETAQVTEGLLAFGMPRPAGACPGFSPAPCRRPSPGEVGVGGAELQDPGQGIHPVAPPLPFQAASARCPSNPLLVSGHP